jgi:hypothetical protein
VSREFATIMAAWGGGTLMALLLAIWVVNSVIVKRQLATSREVWAGMEPRYERVLAMQDELAGKRAIQKELDGWMNSRIEWKKNLLALRDIVPADMQFTKLTIRSDFLETGEPSRRKKVAGEEHVEPPVARQFRFKLVGNAEGARADEKVVMFVDALRHGEEFQGTLDAVNLQGMQRTDGDGEGKRLFAIEGSSPIKDM